MLEQSHNAPTLSQLIDKSCKLHAQSPAVGFAFQTPLSYEELREKSILAAALLRERGIKKGDRVAILSENSPNWGIAYLGVIRLGAIAVPLLPDFPETDVRHILADSEAKILFTSKRQLEKLYERGNTKIKHIITLDDSADRNKLLKTEPLNDFLAAAARLPPKKQRDAPLDAKEEDVVSIIYTSGTSGHSKAVMLTHRNFIANVRSTVSVFRECSFPGWTFLSILPMSHAYEFTISFLLPLMHGCRIVYAGKTPTPTILEKICRAEKPTVMCMVPMVMEKIYKKRILPAINKNAILKTAIKLPLIRQKILRQIGKKLYNFFGGNLKLIAIGGAALNIEVEKFLVEADFPFLVGYGLTETSPLVSVGPYEDPTVALGSAGKPVPGVEVKIVNPNPENGIGEIHVRGPNVMKGYYKNEEATAGTIDGDGWLATGDLGYLDDGNNLFIEGRSKSVIVLSHGENIYPETIEEKINASAQVIESLVVQYNDKLEARVHLDYEMIDNETKGKSQQQKLRFIEDLLKEMQQKVNTRLPAYSQISRIIERQEPFIKTPTHKIKRYLYTNGKAAE